MEESVQEVFPGVDDEAGPSAGVAIVIPQWGRPGTHKAANIWAEGTPHQYTHRTRSCPYDFNTCSPVRLPNKANTLHPTLGANFAIDAKWSR